MTVSFAKATEEMD